MLIVLTKRRFDSLIPKNHNLLLFLAQNWYQFTIALFAQLNFQKIK